ncbi:hypothetical protein DL93DRAFT_2083611 [Clavulina sp. PMI_390]|nr:hypothetical protein DL93DRAFT_2083611 [Clavulina sp. PMI_390]
MAPPAEIQIVVKTHRTAFFVQTPLASTLETVKSNVLAAIKQFADANALEEEGIPPVTSLDSFELYRLEGNQYQVLDPGKGIKDHKITNWTSLYIRFRDENGNLQEMDVTEPKIDDDEEPQSQSQSTVKGKGKA